MAFKRSARVADQMQREISTLLLREVKDPRIGFVTITEVRLSDDMRNARIFFSVLGDPKAKQKALDGLRSATPFIQREVGHALGLRFTPELLFSLDESAERGVRMEALIREARAADEAKAALAPPPPGGETPDQGGGQ
jgi:ribosome-binding factor A